MAKQNRWLIATNTENLKNILAQGLITGPDGFVKYYKDQLEVLPGWMIVYRNAVPKEIIEKAISEDKTLEACILELSLENYCGTIETLKEKLETEDSGSLFNSESQVKKFENMKDVTDDINTILVPLPLPLSSIKTIIFSSQASIDKFKNEVALVSNVPLIDLTFKSDDKLFKLKLVFNPLDLSHISPIHQIDYSLVYAYGGIQIMLFYFAKNGDDSNKIYHSMDELNEHCINTEENIKLVYDYFFSDKTRTDNNIDLRNKLLDALVNSTNCEKANKELFSILNNYDEQKYIKRTKELIEVLTDFEQYKSKETSKYFIDAKSVLEKWLLMMFFKSSSEDLIEYLSSDKNIEFTEEECILFSMVFGIRDKFINISKSLREIEGLQNYISLKMANYAHKLIKNNVQFNISKQEIPLTLRDMFLNEEFKIWFAKKNKLNCFSSTLKLPKGSRTEHNQESIVYYNGNLMDYIELKLDDKTLNSSLSKMKTSKEDYKKCQTQYNKVK